MDENLKKEIQSATLERLIQHLDERKDVLDIDVIHICRTVRPTTGYVNFP